MRVTRTIERSALGLTAGLAAAASVMLAAPRPAAACGGFFCNRSAPVNQAAERIVFSKEADGKVRAIIEVKYDGPSESFAWLLPVEGSPEVDVSSTNALNALQFATNPSYRLNVRVEGECDEDPDVDFGPPEVTDEGIYDAGLAAAPGDSGVEVLDRGTVGPYDYVTISVTDPDGDQVRVAVEWLQDNGYDVTADQAARLRPYLASGQNLIAFRLTKGASTGSIRPIELIFGSGLPAIPIRPTAVAANDDMGVLVWVLGEARAYPVNYRSLVLNDALIDWFNPGRNYDEVVTAAADEAGGQGFVTEYAGSPEAAADNVYPGWTASQWTELRRRGLAGEAPLPELVFDFLNQFGAWDGIRDLLARTLDLTSEQLDEFMMCPGCIDADPVTWLGEHIREGVTAASFVEDAEDLVIAPVRRFAEELDEHPWMTRLYTTMSPEEMTLDPMFDFNASLPEVSNVHTAEQVIECAPGYRRSEAPWRIVLPSGQVVRGEGGRSWPFDEPASAEMPANLLVERVGADGSMVVADNRGQVRERLERHNARVAARTNGRAAGGGLCSVGGTSPVSSGWLLVVAGLLGLARRRRRS